VNLQSDPLRRLAEISAICNDAKIVYNSVSSTALSIGVSKPYWFLGQGLVQ
jgi:Ca2+ transporting ATPase